MNGLYNDSVDFFVIYWLGCSRFHHRKLLHSGDSTFDDFDHSHHVMLLLAKAKNRDSTSQGSRIVHY